MNSVKEQYLKPCKCVQIELITVIETIYLSENKWFELNGIISLKYLKPFNCVETNDWY